MFNYQGLGLLKDKKLGNHRGIEYILRTIFENKSFILYFLSPEIEIKSSLIKSIIDEYGYEVPVSLLDKFKLAALDFAEEDMHASILDMTINENNLIKIFACYAKYKVLPQGIVQRLVQHSKEKDNDSRASYLISILLASYYINNNNFELAEPFIKYCIEYINYNIAENEYENMVSYIICGKYLEKTMDVFVSYAGNYYNLALNIARKIEDEISLVSILSSLSYYYHNVEEREKSINCGYEALSAAEKLNIPILCFNTNKILSIISLTTGDYKKASELMKRTIECSDNIDNFSVIENVKLKNTLGYIYYLKGNFKEALDIHLDAFKSLSGVPSASDVLEEAVKTFDNLSASFKMLGDIKKAIYFADKTVKILKDCNYGHRINDIQNLCKLYTDIGLLYGIFFNDYHSSVQYYRLAKDTISHNDHYIKLGNLSILEAYIQYASSNTAEACLAFERAVRIFNEHGNSNIYVQSLLLCYYLSFANKLSDNKAVYIDTALKISETFQLQEHFNFYYDYFINYKNFAETVFEKDKYPLNLIILLSEERKHALTESKKARDFELIQNFSNRINTILSENELLAEAQNLFNKYFFTKNFIAINHNFKEGLNYIIKACSDSGEGSADTDGFLKDFIIRNNLILNSHGRAYDIFNFSSEGSINIKSMIIYYIYDETNSSTYYFVIFYDKKSTWLFSNEDAEVGLVLIKSLFLKLKSIEYTENIKSNIYLDFATGLYNAKYMWNKLQELSSDESLHRKGFSMVIMDLNDFKKINDTHGHYAGDEAIKFFSKMLKLSLSDIEDIIRYGGDEFVVIFPEKSKQDAEKSIQSIKELCLAQPFVYNGIKIHLDFSYGIDTYSENFSTSKSFFDNVDKQMYLYKLNCKSQNDKV